MSKANLPAAVTILTERIDRCATEGWRDPGGRVAHHQKDIQREARRTSIV